MIIKKGTVKKKKKKSDCKSIKKKIKTTIEAFLLQWPRGKVFSVALYTEGS